MYDNEEIINECKFKDGTLFELEYEFRTKLKELEDKINLLKQPEVTE